MVKMHTLASREEWLANRKNGIGGSEISAVIGQNPYMSNVDLWELKTGKREAEDISQKSCVLYGTKAEEPLRELFKLDFPQYQVFYEENNSFVNSRFPWAQASLDGWLLDPDGRLGIWECKTSAILNSSMWDKWNNRIPQNYYCQCLLYMAVLEADFCVLKAQLKREYGEDISLQTRHYFFEKEDVQEDMDFLMRAGGEFWQENVLKNKKPGLILPEI